MNARGGEITRGGIFPFRTVNRVVFGSTCRRGTFMVNEPLTISINSLVESTGMISTSDRATRAGVSIWLLSSNVASSITNFYASESESELE